jgi:chemotaxis protein CheX
MSTAYVEAFVAAAEEAFSLMLGQNLLRSASRAPRESAGGREVSGLVGISGSSRGMIVVSLDDLTAVNVSEAMLGVRPDSVCSDVLDVVGELTNMIAGGGKTRLNQLDLTIGLPIVLSGCGQSIVFPPAVTPLVAVLGSALGTIQLQVGITGVAEAHRSPAIRSAGSLGVHATGV